MGKLDGTVAIVSAASSPCASGAILRATSTAGRQAGSPAASRASPPTPYMTANPTPTPISTAPIASGIRRVTAGWGEGGSGISFVILYQLRLCRAAGLAGRHKMLRAGVTLNGNERQDMSNSKT